MSGTIRVRAYIVGFGDCILVTVPDDGAPDNRGVRHILIDFGRAPNDSGSLERFPAIAQDIAKECGKRLDLLVMTHEHLDHMEGFYREREVFNQIQVDRVWMSLPSHPNYYTDYPKAKLQKKLTDAVRDFAAVVRHQRLALHPAFASLLANNLANKDRIEYLRKLGKKPVTYLARTKKTGGNPWPSAMKFRILAPEADTSVYYATPAGNALGMALAATSGVSAPAVAKGEFPWDFREVPRANGTEQPGFSASDFARLRRTIREDGVAAARFIDRAQNNTSLCFLLEVGTKRLLFPGDAELESWDMMRDHCSQHLKAVDFLKVAHHGSHNATPMDMLDTLLPVSRASQAQVLVSTKRNVYGTKNPVPDADVLKELKRRCSKLVTTDGVTGKYVELHV
jgi:beta-lactamase superfamily II metal-dependent hydrolase